MLRRFNTAGPCRPDWHYMIPAERRLPELTDSIEQRGLFAFHALQSTGKTTALRQIVSRLRAELGWAAVYCTCELIDTDEIVMVERAIVNELRLRCESTLPVELRPPQAKFDEAGGTLRNFLRSWAKACPKPIAILFDEMDRLRGDSLTSVLLQLRAGLGDRSTDFPAAIVLGSRHPLKLAVNTVGLGYFDVASIGKLLDQHTDETGQPITDEAIALTFDSTGGQPWLVNALAREIIEEDDIPLAEPITTEHVERAKERLILDAVTHWHSPSEVFRAPEIKPVITSILAGNDSIDDSTGDNLRLARDIGLIAPDNPVRIANPIYHEVVARVLAGNVEPTVILPPRSFVRADGTLDIRLLLEEFAAFWREHGEALQRGFNYYEVAPQLVLMAYLQRVVNGGGFIDREYGLGRGRIDLQVRWPHRDEHGRPALQRAVMELKVWREGEKDPLPKGLQQLDGYLSQVGLDRGVLVLFDRRKGAADIEERTRFEEATTPSGRKVTLLRA